MVEAVEVVLVTPPLCTPARRMACVTGVSAVMKLAAAFGTRTLIVGGLRCSGMPDIDDGLEPLDPFDDIEAIAFTSSTAVLMFTEVRLLAAVLKL